ncbi:predicted protein [Sparassis crispa]|uniref:Uncharacterized protein n=1 Tax=Sparassis crispa TaxID=139825 RepID=A0A401GHT8_9APHY|nr:predicted protein [Sparassis crispa]GBE81756.1 predicted protein [Sparassis crispa]
MYCIDCATYNFVEPGSFCAICRRSQTLDTLIRLYPDYGDDTEQRASSSKRGRNADMGREVIDACAVVLKSGDYGADALAPALSKSENLVETLSLSSLSHEASDVGRLLRSLTTMLNEIRSKLQDVERLQQLQDERNSFKQAYKKQKEKLKDLTRIQGDLRMNAEVEIARQRNDLTARASNLQENLQAVISELSTQHARVEQQAHTIEDLEKEVLKWRSDATRYKKKYHVLKTNVNSGMKAAHDGFADDSLVVI